MTADAGRLWIALLLASATLLGACQEQGFPTGPEVQPNFGKVGKPTSGPSVSAVNPSWGRRGDDMLDVTISGSGFAPGAEASWERGGMPDPKIVVHATRFVSASELVATISIGPDAELAYYDVAVILPDRKKGISTESFEVTQAILVGSVAGDPTWTYSTNQAGQLVGYSGSLAFFAERDAAGGWQISGIGTGAGLDIDESGTVIVGRSGGKPVVWSRADNNAITVLPHTDGGNANGIASVNGELMIVGDNTLPKSKGVKPSIPAIWRNIDGSWTLLALPLPAGVSSGVAQDINPRGQIVGRAGDAAAIWEPDAGGYTPVMLGSGSGTTVAFRINDAGTLIVGMSNNRPVYWEWTGTGWSGTQTLEAGGGTCAQEFALGVNDEHRIVGRICEGANWRAAVWESPTATPVKLGGFGKKETGNATAITNGPDPLIAGNADGLAAVWSVY